MGKVSVRVAIILSIIPLTSGCIRLALEMSPSLIPRFAQSIFEECDPDLARHAIPAHLKLMEGLLKNDPDNEQILSSLSMGFTGYSMLFVESEDPDRASRLYLRGRDLGIRSLDTRGRALTKSGLNKEEIRKVLEAIGREQFASLVWTTISWNGWINLNLDKPAALSQLGITQLCLEKIMALDPHYLYGLPYIMMGISLSARPPMFGGDAEKARECFEKAMEIGHGKFLFAYYAFAKYYAVRVQDKGLFTLLIQKASESDPYALSDVCLLNMVIQQKAQELGEKADELFL